MIAEVANSDAPSASKSPTSEDEVEEEDEIQEERKDDIGLKGMSAGPTQTPTENL